MKKLALLLLMFIPAAVMSQASFQNITFDQAMKKATAESKIILVDIMNPKSMVEQRSKIENEIFKQNDVKDFFAKNVICVRMDMSTDAGREFAPRLMMNMYPTYGFYRANGDLIKVVSPFSIAKNPELLLKTATECLALDADKRANTRQINFKDITFDEALKIAEKENKMVFIDAYTDNCQPCMMMAKNIFTLDKVADVFNENFINIKLNLGTVETELAKKYGTRGYPSYLFLNAKGKLIYMKDGYTNADNFIEIAHQAIKKFNGIEFQHSSWNEILEMAKKSGKPIFVDCYTVWCGPCKRMANEVFKEPLVAEYFNQNFINVKLDMEKGEGIELKTKFDVKAFPTFLFLDSDGNILNRIVGSMDGSRFVQMAKDGMSGGGVIAMKKRYNDGERSEQFILNYIDVLSAAYMSQELATVVNEFFATMDMANLKRKEYWDIFMENVNDPDNKVFVYVCDNQQKLGKIHGTNEVKSKINQVWNYGFMKYALQDAQGKNSINTKAYDSFVSRMKKCNVPNENEILFSADTYFTQFIGDWKHFYKIVDKRIKNKKEGTINDHAMYAVGNYLVKNCKDKQIRNNSVKWFEDALARIEAKEKQPKPERGSRMMAAVSMVDYKLAFKTFIVELKN